MKKKRSRKLLVFSLYISLVVVTYRRASPVTLQRRTHTTVFAPLLAIRQMMISSFHVVRLSFSLFLIFGASFPFVSSLCLFPRCYCPLVMCRRRNIRKVVVLLLFPLSFSLSFFLRRSFLRLIVLLRAIWTFWPIKLFYRRYEFYYFQAIFFSYARMKHVGVSVFIL